jgi:hypothetical protein
MSVRFSLASALNLFSPDKMRSFYTFIAIGIRLCFQAAISHHIHGWGLFGAISHEQF